jgi:hypothetical protein
LSLLLYNYIIIKSKIQNFIQWQKYRAHRINWTPPSFVHFRKESKSYRSLPGASPSNRNLPYRLLLLLTKTSPIAPLSPSFQCIVVILLESMDVRHFPILLMFFRFHLCSWRKLKFSFTLVPNWKFQSLWYRIVNFINFCFWRKLILLFNSYLETVKYSVLYSDIVPSDFTAISYILVWTCYSNVLYTSLWFIWTCYFMTNRDTLANR